MTDPMQQARALVEKWRKRAMVLRGMRGGRNYPHNGNFAAAEVLDCADELAAILATPSESASVGGDARDAARYRWLSKHARQNTAYDIYGNGGAWSIGFHSDDNRLTFDAAIDAARALPGDGKEG